MDGFKFAEQLKLHYNKAPMRVILTMRTRSRQFLKSVFRWTSMERNSSSCLDQFPYRSAKLYRVLRSCVFPFASLGAGGISCFLSSGVEHSVPRNPTGHNGRTGNPFLYRKRPDFSRASKKLFTEKTGPLGRVSCVFQCEARKHC